MLHSVRSLTSVHLSNHNCYGALPPFSSYHPLSWTIVLFLHGDVEIKPLSQEEVLARQDEIKQLEWFTPNWEDATVDAARTADESRYPTHSGRAPRFTACASNTIKGLGKVRSLPSIIESLRITHKQSINRLFHHFELGKATTPHTLLIPLPYHIFPSRALQLES